MSIPALLVVESVTITTGASAQYTVAQRAKQIMKLCREAVQKNSGKKERTKESDLMVVIITHD
jgi:hypothetical protein